MAIKVDKMKSIVILIGFCFLSGFVIGQPTQNKKSTVSAGGGTHSGGAFKTTVSVGDPGTASLSGGAFKTIAGFYPPC